MNQPTTKSAERALKAEQALSRQAAPEAPTLPELVNRFLAWPMPDSLSARIAPNVTKPIGTHLMNADEAKAMLEYVLATPADSKTACGQCFGKGVIANIGETCDLCNGSGRESDEEAAAKSESCACGTHTKAACDLAGVCGQRTATATHQATQQAGAAVGTPQEQFEEALACALTEHTNIGTDGIDEYVPRIIGLLPRAALPFEVVPSEGTDPVHYEPAPTYQIGAVVEYQGRMRPMWRPEGEGWTDWTKCSRGTYDDYRRVPINNDWQFEARALGVIQPAATTASTPKVRCEECKDGSNTDWQQGPCGPIECKLKCDACEGSGEVEATTASASYECKCGHELNVCLATSCEHSDLGPAPSRETAAPLSDAEFLSKRLARVAKLAGVTMPDHMTHEDVAAVAGTILGDIARALETGRAQANKL
jgi:hypothetical protein